MSARRTAIALATALVASLATACTTLPDTGAVHSLPDRAGGATQAPYFAPPGPAPGDTREEVVRGFLLAMQANPPSTSVARSYLSSRARATWQPNDGTLVYDATSLTDRGDVVRVRLSDAHRLDPHGAWVTDTGGAEASVDLRLVVEDGEWRIANPPDALAVPASYFAGIFVPFDLYFLDNSDRALVPSKVYLPRGEQTATALVRALLAGPPASLAGAVHNALPAGTELDLGVVVSRDGLAVVPLGQQVLDMAPADLNRAVVQLAHTLGQVPGVTRLRLTVEGAPVPLSDGRSEVSVTEGAELDPVRTSGDDLRILAGGRVLTGVQKDAPAVGGPFGRSGFALRSFAAGAAVHEVAAVAANGRRVYVAPDSGSATATRVRTVLAGATDLLRPAYDRFGGLWLVDRTGAGAKVRLVQGGSTRVLRVPGLTGRPVSSFLVTRDGARLVAGESAGSSAVLVSTLVRDRAGRVVRALPATRIDLGGVRTVRDVGQVGTTTVAVLAGPTAGQGPDRLLYVQLDGSPGPAVARGPELVPEQLSSLVVSPDPDIPMRAVSQAGRLLRLTDAGRWEAEGPDKVVGAGFVR